MQLSPVRHAELHSDLKIQEKDELQWKKVKVEGLDDNGEKEAQLRRNFNGETLVSWAVSTHSQQRLPRHHSVALCHQILDLSNNYAFNTDEVHKNMLVFNY